MNTGLGMECGTDGHRTRDGRWDRWTRLGMEGGTDGHRSRDGFSLIMSVFKAYFLGLYHVMLGRFKLVTVLIKAERYLILVHAV